MSTVKADKDRRLRRYRVSQDVLVLLMGNRFVSIDGDNKAVFGLPYMYCLPADAKILAVDYRFEYQALEFIACHSSFDHVPPENLIPDFAVYMQLIDVEVSVDEVVAGLLKSEPARVGQSAAKSADKPAWEFLGPPPKG